MRKSSNIPSRELREDVILYNYAHIYHSWCSLFISVDLDLYLLSFLFSPKNFL